MNRFADGKRRKGGPLEASRYKAERGYLCMSRGTNKAVDAESYMKLDIRNLIENDQK